MWMISSSSDAKYSALCSFFVVQNVIWTITLTLIFQFSSWVVWLKVTFDNFFLLFTSSACCACAWLSQEKHICSFNQFGTKTGMWFHCSLTTIRVLSEREWVRWIIHHLLRSSSRTYFEHKICTLHLCNQLWYARNAKIPSNIFDMADERQHCQAHCDGQEPQGQHRVKKLPSRCFLLLSSLHRSRVKSSNLYM